MKAQIVLILLVALSHQECVKGCQKCSSTGNCQVCNVVGGFYAVNNTCAQTTLTNCALLAQSGSCTVCAASYYLDSATSKCVAVPTANAIANCAIYSGASACSACSDGYFISAGACLKANTTIANCRAYSNDGVCAACADGFVASLNGTNCTAVPASAGCLLYTYAGCSRCNSGYIMNRNLFLGAFKSAADPAAWILSNIGSIRGSALSVCEAVTVTNCAVVASAGVCATCIAGYYLDNGACVVNPDPVVPNCAVYSSLVYCTDCKTGFFANGGVCTAVVPIAYCQTYSTSLAPTTCIACNSTAYVNNNVCTNRTVSSIPNCMTNAPNADQCGTCNTGYRLTTDGKNCLAVIANCATYQTWNTGDTAFRCQTCSSGYYVATTNGVTACTQGTISNCNDYTSSTDCAVCKNNYYRASATTCTQHITIPNCNLYHATAANTCATCNAGYLPFAYAQTCVAISSLVANCQRYDDSTGNCAACNSGYWLNSAGTTCTAIVSSTNCASMDSSQNCVSCSAGYHIWNVPNPDVCVTPFNFITTNCDTVNPSTSFSYTSSNNACQICKTNNIPYRPLPAEAVCIKDSDLPILGSGQTIPVTNCVRYGVTIPSVAGSPSTVTCMECAANFFILGYEASKEGASGRTCDACSTAGGAKMVLADDLLGTVNICITQGTFSAASPIYGTRGARFAYNVNNAGDYRFISVDASGILQVALSDSTSPEIHPSSATTAITTSTKYLHGFSLGETGVLPTVFNYKGVPTSAAVVKPTPTPDWTPNCELSGQILAIGSISKAGGVAGGASSNYWSVISADTWVCFKCVAGFQLSFAAMNPSPTTNNIPYPKCVAMTTCANNAIVGGLPLYLNALVNCYTCNANLFPTIYWEYQGYIPSGQTVYKNGLTNFLMKTDVSGLGFDCAASQNVLTTTSTTAAALANCGVYGNLAAMTDATNKVVGTAFAACLACAANFVPTYAGTTTTGGLTSGSFLPHFAVTQCTASTNCKTDSTPNAFNTCGRCRIDQASLTPPVYYAYTDHTMSHCQPAASNNCFILNPVGITTSANVCKICASGYFLNQDNFCEQLTVANLASGATFSPAYFAKAFATTTNKVTDWSLFHVRVHYLLSFQKTQYGASACATGFTRATPSFYNQVICATSNYLSGLASVPQGSQYIPNCAKYAPTLGSNVAPFYTCAVCATNFIPKSDGTACVATLANCLQAKSDDTTKCYMCASGWWNVRGGCVQTTLANCTALANTQTFLDADLTCSQCNSGFYLDGTVCKPGSIQNCDVYSNGNDKYACTRCLAGFVLTQAKNVAYCYPIPTSLNCTVLGQQNGQFNNAEGIRELKVTCAACTSVGSTNPTKKALWSSQTTTGMAQNVCLAYSAITNCVTYDDSISGNSALNTASLLCTKCADGFYLSSDKIVCVARTVKPAQCATYYLSQDKCLTCNAGYFKNVAESACIAFPVGIPFCATYSNAATCTKCASGYYLSSNACLLSFVVANCAAYSANNTCVTCAAGFFLTNATLCTQATAQNCLTYSSASACATCSPGWALTTANSITSCTAITIANCAILSATNQNVCGYCSAGYYLNSASVCTAVTAAVSNCAYHSSATKCSNCTAGYILSTDGLACMNNYTSIVDANCADAFLQTGPTCFTCGYGSVMGPSGCQACAATGCGICDPANTTACLLCGSGYFMNAAGACNVNDPVSNTTNTTPTPVTPSGVDRLTLATSLVMLVAIVFRFD